MMNQSTLNFGEVNPVITPEVGQNLLPLPSLAEVDSLGFDTETTAEPRLEDRKFVGLSYRLPNGRKAYVPGCHPGGGNYELENIRAWAKGELAGKQLIVANAKHEVDTMLRFGVDLEALGVTFRDVFHQAALLNDHRYRLNLGLIAREELNYTKTEVDHALLHTMPAAEAGKVAIEDADLVWLLNEAYAPKITAEGLQDVLDLEDALVYCTASMQRAGAHLDIPKLIRWRQEVTEEYNKRVILIFQETGLRVKPTAGNDMQKLFRYKGIEHTGFSTDSGNESFAEEAIEKFAGYWDDGDRAITPKHECQWEYLTRGGCACRVCHKTWVVTDVAVNAALEARQLASLKNKYLDPYLEKAQPDGRIFYQLHQLRGDEYGTITGRYSSSKDKNGFGINIQQVSKRDKQPPLLQRWDVRELYISPPGRVWASADASQIELRFLAHHAAMLGMPRLAKEYNANPWVDFHELMIKWTGLIRDFAKNVTFCKTYGGGPDKVAYMCKVSKAEGRRIVGQYDREFPEAKKLLKLAEQQALRVGYVRTFLGRRRRYTKEDSRHYSALNAVFQGGAADAMKLKLLESYNNRKLLDLTLRFTVHDEKDGDLSPDVKAKERWAELCNGQTMDLAVPIMWKVDTGANWSEAH